MHFVDHLGWVPVGEASFYISVLSSHRAKALLIPVGRSGWAIAAGYLELFPLVLISAPISVIVSILAHCDIRRSQGTAKVKHGVGRAILGNGCWKRRRQTFVKDF